MKKLALFGVTAVLLLSLAACSGYEKDTEVYNGFTTIESNTGSAITSYQGLIYRDDTKIIYILIDHYQQMGLTPYISENGNFCRYIDGEIVEVIK